MRNRRFPPLHSSLCRLALGLGIFSLGSTLRGQEVPRPSLARTYTQTSLPTFYNVKLGPILFRADASLRTEFVDNVTLGDGKHTPREGDIIIAPELDIDAMWTITPLNTLQLHTGLSYTKYIDHPRLDSSSLLASPDSVLSFNIYTGDLKINLHEQFSYEEDPVSQGAISNVSKFGRFTNIAGIQLLWDLNDVIATLGYDHTNEIATGAISSSGANLNVGNLSYNTDEVTASAFFSLMTALGGGLEATATDVRYTSDASADSTRASIGPFLEAQITHFTKISLSGGYQGVYSNGGGRQEVLQPDGTITTVSNNGGNGGNWYANLTIANRFNRFVTNRLSIGHENEIGILSANTENTYARLSSNIQFAPQMALDVEASYQDTKEGGSLPSIFGFSSSHYQLFTLNLTTSYQITKKLSASLGYQFSLRTSSNSGVNSQNYTQNRLILGLTYRF